MHHHFMASIAHGMQRVGWEVVGDYLHDIFTQLAAVGFELSPFTRLRKPHIDNRVTTELVHYQLGLLIGELPARW